MNFLNECRLFNRTFTFDDISKKPECKNVKFKRAFQFLQLLLFQRVYGIDVITRSSIRRTSKQQQSQFEVFLGGSCNPTTWRYEQAIPYFELRSISYYNPQVANWTPDLIEIEHRAKESAPLLFFVIDHNTRSLAAIAEVCYLAARRRNIIIIINSMPDDRNQTKFIQQKTNSNDNENDYDNVCEARRTLRILLQSINVPVFDNIRVALECAAFILETTKQTVIHSNIIDEEKKIDHSEREQSEEKFFVPLQNLKSPASLVYQILSSVVVSRTTFESSDDVNRQINQSDMILSSPVSSHRRHSINAIRSPTFLNPFVHSIYPCRPLFSTKTQISYSPNESDDDGYGSLISSNRTLSRSPSSIFSDLCEYSTDENNSSRFYLPISILNNIISIFSLYISFVTPPIILNSPVIQSVVILGRRIKTTLFPTITNTVPSNDEGATILFDLYIASGDHDKCWLNSSALPLLDEINIKYTTRQGYHENDQLDILYDIHIRKHSRLLYYLINDNERLSYLITELAFLIGERKYHIIVCLQTTINENSENIYTKTEREDIQRSRKYLADIAKKEKIVLCQSREQSWQHVLAFLLHN